MGKTITPTYRLEYTETTQSGRLESHKIAWKSDLYGRLNMANVVKYLRVYEASTQDGGYNSHIGVRKVLRYSAIRQKDNTPVLSGSMPQTVA